MQRKRLYTCKDIALLIGRDAETARRYCRTGKIKAWRIGGQFIITDGNLKKFLGQEAYSGLIDTLPSWPVDEQVEGGE